MTATQNRSMPVSLTGNFRWMFAANIISAGSQWLVFSMIAKITNPVVLGTYALALAICGPLMIIANFNIGIMLVTDINRRHRFRAYRIARSGMVTLALILLLIICTVTHLSQGTIIICLIVGVSLALECVSELYHSLMQRRERMSPVAKSLICRGLMSASAAGAVLFFTRSLIWTVCAMVLCRLTILLSYDLRMRTKGDLGTQVGPSGVTDWRAAGAILWSALPIATVTVLVALVTNIPRYFIAHFRGPFELGIFAAMWSLITAGNMIAIALGQALFPRFARLYAEKNSEAFLKLLLSSALIGASLAVLGIITAGLFGRFILRILYRPEYAAAHDIFLGLMASGALLYIITVLGHAATAAKSFSSQAKLMAVVTATMIAANFWFVPRFGLWGVVLSIAVANGVYLLGMVAILFRLTKELQTHDVMRVLVFDAGH